MGDTHSLYLAIITVCCGGTVLASNPEFAGNANSLAPRSAPAALIAEVVDASAESAGPVTIFRAEDGLFYLDGRVAGETVRFLVDTGANLTLLAPADAARAGIEAGGKTMPLATANGTSEIDSSTIERLDLAGHGLDRLRVGIGGKSLPVSLLGQDALSRLGIITIEANELTIHPPR